MFKLFGINVFARDEDTSIKNSPFSTKQMFKSREELFEWTQNKARSLGYVIINKRSKAYVNNFVYKVILMCDRGGEYKATNTVRASGTRKTNCKFELEGKYSKEHNKWRLRVICDDHNHPPAQHMEGHPYVRRLSVDETRLVEDLTRKNLAPRDILSTLKAQNENNVSVAQTIYNAQQKIRRREQAGKTPMQVLMSLLHTNNYLYELTTGDSNELENLFFVHPTSWKIWRAFPHVLMIDATYKTNKYNKPLVEIVGMTSTRKTFSVGFAFIDREKEANYTWVLNCVKSILDKCMHPRVIITDRELALINACQTVFPDAARLLCRWHIEQNILKISSKIITLDDDRDSFRVLWKLLVESPTLMTYTENYKRLQSMLINYPRVMRYIDDTWLNKYKEMFVSVWVDQHLNFGNNTTNRAESQHSKLKKILNSSNSNLDKFVQRINQVVQSQLTSIYESFENSLTVRYNHHNLSCFQLLRGHVSNEALDIILGEVQRLGDVMLDSSNCGCKLRNSCGLPCACMLSFYSISGESIPLDSIDIFWRKLDISDTTSVVDDDINCDDVVDKYKENFNKQSKAGKMFYRRKLEEIYDPHKTDVGEPTVQKNTRGRPSVKKQQKKKVNPPNHAPRRCSFSTTSEFNGMDLNKEPERHSFSCGIDLNDEPQRYSFSCGIDLNDEPRRHYPFQMNGIPDIFHDYIDDIHDVEGDGNCGFRAVAVCLGYNEDQWLYIRKQLLEELESQYYAYHRVFTDGFNEVYQSLRWFESPAPLRRHWLHMPLTGYLIANKFGVIVHCLSHAQSTTCFPLWRGPEDFQPHRAITLVLVNNIHYMSVFLKGNYPMPPTTAYWNTHKSLSASTWQTMYWPRFDLYNQLRSRTSERHWIHIKD